MKSSQNGKIKQILVWLINLLCNTLNPSHSLPLISLEIVANETVETFGAFQFLLCSNGTLKVNEILRNEA